MHRIYTLGSRRKWYLVSLLSKELKACHCRRPSPHISLQEDLRRRQLHVQQHIPNSHGLPRTRCTSNNLHKADQEVPTHCSKARQSASSLRPRHRSTSTIGYLRTSPKASLRLQQAPAKATRRQGQHIQDRIFPRVITKSRRGSEKPKVVTSLIHHPQLDHNIHRPRFRLLPRLPGEKAALISALAATLRLRRAKADLIAAVTLSRLDHLSQILQRNPSALDRQSRLNNKMTGKAEHRQKAGETTRPSDRTRGEKSASMLSYYLRLYILFLSLHGGLLAWPNPIYPAILLRSSADAGNGHGDNRRGHEHAVGRDGS